MDIGNVVWNLANKNLTRYNMPYEKYLKEKEIREEQYLKDYNKQQEFIKRTENLIKKKSKLSPLFILKSSKGIQTSKISS